MRRAFGALVVIGALAAVPLVIQAQAEQTWKGAISDSNCNAKHPACLLYTSPSPRDRQKSRMPSSA